MATRQELLDAAAALKAKIGPADATKAAQALAAAADLRTDADQMDTLADNFEAADGATKQTLLANQFDDLLRANATTNRRLATVIEALIRAQ